MTSQNTKKIISMMAVGGLTLSGADQIARNPNIDFLSDQWYFTADVKTENYIKIPSKSIKFKLGKDHGINLDVIAGKTGKCNDECIVYNLFELKEACELGFGAGADWWMEVYLNGKKIFSTVPKGNEIGLCSDDNHVFSGKGRKGKNLLAVTVRRGDGSWSFYLKEKPFSSVHPSYPAVFAADAGKIIGKIKPMNAVNNGPAGSRGRSNREAWKAAAIPYARNHDASFYSGYGGQRTVDVHAIFPDFSKDPNDPASYHFAETDRYLKSIRNAGTQVFYRLGSKIEHGPQKYGTKVPPDFQKWAVVCEHIIRHYNEGWANGFKMGIDYWEIWNEPDLGHNQYGSPTWQGTKEQFFELYRTAASHLKKCFPKLKIGGPALTRFEAQWMKEFLADMTRDGKRVPLDFYSWHFYGTNPRVLKGNCLKTRKVLDDFGYTETESILNEWNYVRGWSGETYNYSIQAIIGLKGAAFAAACMCAGQDAPLDMLMYYDARPSGYNGLFDFYTYSPLKTYYVFLAWSKLMKLSNRILVDTLGKTGIYAVGATDGKKTGILISRFFEKDDLPQDLPVTLTLKNGDLRGVRLYLIDDTHDLTEIPYRMDKNGSLMFNMKANTIVYLEK